MEATAWEKIFTAHMPNTTDAQPIYEKLLKLNVRVSHRLFGYDTKAGPIKEKNDK